MYLICASQITRIVPPGECEAPVRHQIRLEAKVTGHADSSLNRVVRYHTDDDKRAKPRVPQSVVQISADEGAVGLLSDDHLAGSRRDLGFELIARTTRTVW